MGITAGVIAIVSIVFVSITVITLASIWMGTSYAAKKRGFVQGASKREVELIQGDIDRIRQEISELKEQIAELIIVTKDSV